MWKMRINLKIGERYLVSFAITALQPAPLNHDATDWLRPATNVNALSRQLWRVYQLASKELHCRALTTENQHGLMWFRS